MSSLIEHGKKYPGLRLAIATLVLWLVGLGVMWAFFGADQGGGFINFVARFHVLLVHLPIGILLLVAALEILAFGKSERALAIKKVIPTILWLAMWGTVMATLLGYLLMTVEDIAGKAMTLHLWTGLGVGVFAILALIFKLAAKEGLYGVSLFLGILAVSAAGHYGGAMVHEPEYMAEYAPEPLKPLMYAGLTPKENTQPKVEAMAVVDGEVVDIEAEPVETPIEERVVFTDFVLPVLEAKCTECHNENKIKGKLRMDTYEMLIAGADGSDFETLIPGNPDESEMLVRVTLEEDHDEFMPPKGDALTPEETAMLAWWVKTGASPDGTVASLSATDEDKQLLVAVAAGLEGEEDIQVEELANVVSEWDTFSEEERALRMQKAEDAANSYNFSIMPISAEDDRLRINVVNASKDFGDDALKELEPVAERIVWLDLARSQVSDEGMKIVGKFYNVERLHLENTKVTDAGIAELKSLRNLEYLNLYGTEVTNQIFDTFAVLPNLKKLYLWQTNVESSAARAFERSVNLEINTGYEMVAAEVSEEAAEPKKEEPKPVEKKEVPKKETPVAAKPAPKPAETKPKPAPAPKVAEKKSEPVKQAANPKPAPTPAAKEMAKKEAPKPAATEPKPAPKKAEAPAPKPVAKNPEPTKPASKPKPAATPAPKEMPKKEASKPAATEPTPAPKQVDTPPAKPAAAEKPAAPAKSDTPPAAAKKAPAAAATDSPKPADQPKTSPAAPAVEAKP